MVSRLLDSLFQNNPIVSISNRLDKGFADNNYSVSCKVAALIVPKILCQPSYGLMNYSAESSAEFDPAGLKVWRDRWIRWVQKSVYRPFCILPKK